MADLTIQLVKSTIGCNKSQIATAHTMHLKRIGDVSVQPDNKATRGKLRKIAHLITVEEAKGGAGK